MFYRKLIGFIYSLHTSIFCNMENQLNTIPTIINRIIEIYVITKNPIKKSKYIKEK